MPWSEQQGRERGTRRPCRPLASPHPSPQARFRHVVFDLDGTLVDSAPDLQAAAAAMLRDLGRPPLSLAQIKGFVGNGIAKLVERCLAASGGPPADPEAALAAFRRSYAAAPVALTRPYPGVAAALQRLRGAGIRLGVCTNKPQAPALAVLEGLRLADHFAAVVGGDLLPVLKPDPAPLRLCLDLLGAAGGPALFVGDSETDAATARNAGLPFALFTEGYRKSPVESFEAELVFSDYAALGGLLGQAPAAP